MTETRNEKIEAHWVAQCASHDIEDPYAEYVNWSYIYGDKTVVLDGDFDIPRLEAVIATLRFLETL